MRANPSPTDILQTIHNRTRQSQENRQFHQDFLSNFMQSYSINLGNPATHTFQDPPRSPNALNRTPPPRTPLTKTSVPNALLSTTIAHVRESSPVKNFYELKQKYFEVKPKADSETPEPPRNVMAEAEDYKSGGSVFDNVGKMLEKIKKKHEGWNLVEDKLVSDINRNRAGGRTVQPPLDDDDVKDLIDRVKRKINKTEKQEIPEKDGPVQKSEQATARFEDEDGITRDNLPVSPFKDKNRMSPPPRSAQKQASTDISVNQRRNQFEQGLEAEVSPIKPVKDENTNMSIKVSFDDKEEDEEIIVRKPKGKPPQTVIDSKVTDKVNAGSRVSGSSEPSETVSFNISDSAVTGSQEMRKSNISEKENLSGGSNLTSSQEKPPVATSFSKTKKPEVNRRPEKVETSEKDIPEKPKEKEEVRISNQNENAKTIPRAPVMPQKPMKKEVPERPVVDKKPKFMNSFKSKMAQLKEMYAGKTIEPLPGEAERPSRPVHVSAGREERVEKHENEIKEEEREISDSLSEEKEEKVSKRPEILVMDGIDFNITSPLKDSAKNSRGVDLGTSFDNMMSYSKLTDEKIGIDDTAAKIRDEQYLNHQNFLDHPILGASPVPKKHLDFERASEISFNVSPEESLMYPESGKTREHHNAKKAIQPHQVPVKPVEFEWTVELEKEFEAYCNRDLEIMKLRSKINYLEGEIALASM